MKEIVSLKKILNNETVLQIYVRVMLGISVDAYNFMLNHHLDGQFKQQQYGQSSAEISTLHEPRL